MAIGSLASGKILATLGWAFVNEVFFPLIVVAAAMLVWLSLWRRRTA
jgi:hypothetical protein